MTILLLKTCVELIEVVATADDDFVKVVAVVVAFLKPMLPLMLLSWRLLLLSLLGTDTDDAAFVER